MVTEVYLDSSLDWNQYWSSSRLWKISCTLYSPQTMVVRVSPLFARAEKDTTPIMQHRPDMALMVREVPRISPSLSGWAISSCTRVEFRPNCITGTTNATMEAA